MRLVGRYRRGRCSPKCPGHSSRRERVAGDSASCRTPISIVASEIGSYKPAHGHWQAFEKDVGRLPEVHVAASLFHDVAPTSELGIPCFWINRLGEDSDGYAPARESPTLVSLAEVLDELAP